MTRERESQRSTVNKSGKRKAVQHSRGGLNGKVDLPPRDARHERELSEEWGDHTDNSAWLAYAPRGLKNPLSLLSSYWSPLPPTCCFIQRGNT